MRCFAWSDKESCADLLNKLPEPWTSAKEFTITDPSDGVEYSVVVYDKDGEIPADYDEAKATEEFLALINTIIFPCDVMTEEP